MSYVRWMVRYGVDNSHMVESDGVLHKTKRAGVAALHALVMVYPVKLAQLMRLEFDAPLHPATHMHVVLERRGFEELPAGGIREEVKP